MSIKFISIDGSRKTNGGLFISDKELLGPVSHFIFLKWKKVPVIYQMRRFGAFHRQKDSYT